MNTVASVKMRVCYGISIVLLLTSSYKGFSRYELLTESIASCTLGKNTDKSGLQDHIRVPHILNTQIVFPDNSQTQDTSSRAILLSRWQSSARSAQRKHRAKIKLLFQNWEVIRVTTECWTYLIPRSLFWTIARHKTRFSRNVNSSLRVNNYLHPCTAHFSITQIFSVLSGI